MNKLKTAIIGCGKVGHLHAAALTELEESEFTAVCDTNIQRAREFASQYNVKPYADPKEMINDSNIQTVNICVPHPFHVTPTVIAENLGTHVLVEKPLASSLQDCNEMLTAAKRNNVTLGVVCQRRFYAPCQRIRKAIDEGRIGTPILGTVTMYGWRDKTYYDSDPWRGTWDDEGGGVLVNQAPHQLDLLQWYMGPIEEMFGFWSNLNHPYIKVDDTAVAVIRFKSGALGNIIVSNSQNPALYGKVMISGSNGATIGVQTDGGAMFIAGMTNIIEPPINDYWTVAGEEAMLKKWQKEDSDFFNSINAMNYYHKLQIQDFLQAVMHGRDPLVTGEDGRRTVEMFTAIYRSQQDKKLQVLPYDKSGGMNEFIH